MAVKTKAQILAEIASLLADNSTGNISALDIRTCLNDITDSYFDANYKNLVFNMKQTGTSVPVFVDTAGANNPLQNSLGETPTWGRTAAGLYTLTVVAPLFDKSKLHLNGCVSVGTTATLAATIIDAGGVGGYVYFARATDYVLNIYSVTDAFVLADLSTILTNDVFCFPEIRSYV